MSSKLRNGFRTFVGVLVINILVLSIVTGLFEYDRFSRANGDTTVYTTITGECYHQSSCSSLSHSKYKTTLEKAVQNGYRQCSLCDPPALKHDAGFHFDYVHYVVIVPFAAMWGCCASCEIFWLDTKNKFLAYLPHLGLCVLLSFVFDLIV